jgi:hypothetical protein
MTAPNEHHRPNSGTHLPSVFAINLAYVLAGVSLFTPSLYLQMQLTIPSSSPAASQAKFFGMPVEIRAPAARVTGLKAVRLALRHRHVN